ncbi:(2Fe-2S)-binding protein [Alcaligenes sp. SDU_A2]|uniref:(2Fe-2S)-binding protein n=1 Tax=Alcaligenes sp. SDU_A2 TaxID=3136634 RepID=UPI00311F9E0A
MHLELLLNKILALVPEYKVFIYPEKAALSTRFNPPAHTQLFRFDSAQAPMYLSLLHEKLAQAQAQAGKIYWSTTAWRIVTWNPILLSIMAVHSIGRGLCLQGCGLWVTQESIEGSALENHAAATGPHDALIDYAGQQIKLLFEQLHGAATQSFPLPLKLAQKLTTDSIIECLIMQNELAGPAQALDQTELQTRLNKWLGAANLPLVSGTLLLPNGRLGLNRQVCCQYYRVEPGAECPDCTRIPMQKRLLLMAEHAH